MFSMQYIQIFYYFDGIYVPLETNGVHVRSSYQKLNVPHRKTNIGQLITSASNQKTITQQIGVLSLLAHTNIFRLIQHLKNKNSYTILKRKQLSYWSSSWKPFTVKIYLDNYIVIIFT